MGKLFVQTYGCQMNVYDSQKIAELLKESHNLEMTENADEADVILMNTCSVREKAQEKVFTQLGRWRNWRAAKPHRVLGVGGCVAAQEGAAIRERAPHVDVIFGPQTLHRLPDMLRDIERAREVNHAKARRTVRMDISFPEIEKFDRLPKPEANGVAAFVSIMEGCSKYCSFCVVPYTRGDEISRPFASVMSEVEALAAQGVREVTLLGQNVNAYLDTLPDGTVCDLATLMAFIDKVPGIARIRFTTSHPVEMTKHLIASFADTPSVMPQLHLPVQSGSDLILRAMKRNYTALEYKGIIRALRAVCPDIHLSSDFIVGFPGETDADFAATYALVEEVVFTRAFSFLYSPRPGTPAANISCDVSEAAKKERLYALQALLARQNQAALADMVGTEQTVLVERLSRQSAEDVAGRTANNWVVNMAGDANLIGELVTVEITDCGTNSLRGVVR